MLLKFKGVCYDLDHVFSVYLYFLLHYCITHHLLRSIVKHRYRSVLIDGVQ